MKSIALIQASDGSGNASVATVSNARSALATTIQVDTVSGIPTYFIATMGTPHTFTDPVTSETITVISEATAVDFAGHVDGSNLEIDEIAAGYTDAGSSVGDIVIIRPTTEWSNNLYNLLSEAHDDDGTLKDGAVHSSAVLADASVTNAKLSTTTGEIGGAWGTWTPTYENFTLGSGTATARYTQIGKTVDFAIQIALSGSTMGTDPTISLPVTARSGMIHSFSAYALDTGTSRHPLLAFNGTTTKINLFAIDASATYAKQVTIGSGVPMTWANGDTIYITGTYEAA